MTVDHEAAAAAVLGSVVPMSEDPDVAAFEDDFARKLAAEVAVRPSPSATPPDPVTAALQVVSGQLMTVIHQNAAIIELLGKGATP